MHIIPCTSVGDVTDNASRVKAGGASHTRVLQFLEGGPVHVRHDVR